MGDIITMVRNTLEQREIPLFRYAGPAIQGSTTKTCAGTATKKSGTATAVSVPAHAVPARLFQRHCSSASLFQRHCSRVRCSNVAVLVYSCSSVVVLAYAVPTSLFYSITVLV